MARIVLAGYLVRNPLGGYAWQAAHYLLGLRALGHDAWFYEDTGHYAPAYNPRTGEFGEVYDYGVRAAADFLGRLGLGENIGTDRSPLPTAGYTWHPTRPPVVVAQWTAAGPPGPAYTTIGTWDAVGRDIAFGGETFEWRKRTEWLRCLDLPARTGAAF